MAFFLSLRRKLWFVEEWKGCVRLCVLCAYLGVNFDGNPNWVLNFDFPKWVLNNARLGVILFQTWHLSLNNHCTKQAFVSTVRRALYPQAVIFVILTF